VLFDEAQILLPYLGKLLARSERAGFLCEWLTASR
jgi:hypothetical protein